MRGSTWSPEMSTFFDAHHNAACSGAWPNTVMTSQSWPPMEILSPCIMRRYRFGKAGTPREYPLPLRAASGMISRGRPWAK
jgi:hypothetical protein